MLNDAFFGKTFADLVFKFICQFYEFSALLGIKLEQF